MQPQLHFPLRQQRVLAEYWGSPKKYPWLVCQVWLQFVQSMHFIPVSFRKNSTSERFKTRFSVSPKACKICSSHAKLCSMLTPMPHIQLLRSSLKMRSNISYKTSAQRFLWCKRKWPTKDRKLESELHTALHLVQAPAVQLLLWILLCSHHALPKPSCSRGHRVHSPLRESSQDKRTTCVALLFLLLLSFIMSLLGSQSKIISSIRKTHGWCWRAVGEVTESLSV